MSLQRMIAAVPLPIGLGFRSNRLLYQAFKEHSTLSNTFPETLSTAIRPCSMNRMASPQAINSRASIYSRSSATFRHRFHSTPPVKNVSDSGASNTETNAASEGAKINKHLATDFEFIKELYPSIDPAENSAWYILVATTLLAFRKENMLEDLWFYLSTTPPFKNQDDKLLIAARRLRETMLKASVLVGFPKGITGLSTLHKAISTHTPSLIPLLDADAPLRRPLSPEEKLTRGKEFFSKIYAQHTDSILKSMSDSSGGELSYFALNSVYGELMAETSIVDAKDTVLMEFVCCMAGLAGPQAKGHMYGSLNMGASEAELKGTIAIVAKLTQSLAPYILNTMQVEMPFLSKYHTWEVTKSRGRRIDIKR